MAKKNASQWDFGELFPRETRPPERKVLSVSELTAQVRCILEQHVGRVWVTGEVTNLSTQRSGHMYFTLKDAGAQLNCVLFRSEPMAHRALLQDGQKLLIQGDITVYEARGQYQLIVRSVELQGTGALQIAFDRLKQKLQAEGLFAPERKRPLPRFPQRIGLVTSPTGAAIRDVLHVIRRRNPALEIVLAPCRVQGDGAAREIAAAIRLLNEFAAGRADPKAPGAPGLDLILITRGGGSIEDLWAFNEEIVARAIFDSAVPVVSGVGHEIDFTIADFVADLRAATPSAAAEIITEGVFSSCAFVSQASGRLQHLLRQRLRDKQEEFEDAARRLARMHPRRRFNEWLQRLDDLHASLLRCVQSGARSQKLVAD
ncbi:MAG TPA: exodeoxyribonuclease VII large subunit, partial [Verrucomicrobiota bacterium]|nr:exodeoxyribonuclease VII large subunit [Verrucomicrobiota bacterium]